MDMDEMMEKLGDKDWWMVGYDKMTNRRIGSRGKWMEDRVMGRHRL